MLNLKMMMWRTYRLYLCLATAWIVVLLASCTQQEENEQTATPSFFSHTDGRLTSVIAQLQQIEEKEPFEAYFRKWYGIPLWDYADIDRIEGGICYYAPVYDERWPRSIRTIWFFHLDSHSQLTQAIMFKEDEAIRENNQEGEFDYLAFKIFGAENPARLIFEENRESTRAWVSHTICRDAYVIVGPCKEYKGTTCKSYNVWVDETAPPGGNDGTNVRWPDGGDEPIRSEPYPGDDGGGGCTGGGGVNGGPDVPPLPTELVPIIEENENFTKEQLEKLKKKY